MSSVTEVLYYLFLFPLEQLMSWVLHFAYRVTGSYGVSVVLLGFTINLVMVPFYRMADRWKSEERAAREAMAWELDSIETHSSGWEKFYYRKEVFRRHGYHPIAGLKVSLGFLIQIPFFFAAYHLLSGFEAWQGIGFGVIADLAQPDGLVRINQAAINLLPLIMTAINLLAIQAYGGQIDLREKLQLWAMAALFLVVLYPTASGLVLYWTVNNAWALGRALIMNRVRADSVSGKRKGLGSSNTPIAGAVLAGLLVVLYLFARFGSALQLNGQINALFVLVVAFLAAPSVHFVICRYSLLKNMPGGHGLFVTSTILACFTLFVVHPVNIYVSMDELHGPLALHLPALLTLLVAISLMSLLIYSLSGPAVQKTLTLIATFAVTVLLFYSWQVNVGLLDYFQLNDPNLVRRTPLQTGAELFVLLLYFGLLLVLIARYYRALTWICAGVLAAAVVSVILLVADSREAALVDDLAAFPFDPRVESQDSSLPEESANLIRFSESENILILVLDAFPGAFMQKIREESPEVFSSFEGFVWYSNSLTAHTGTWAAMPAITGGQRYVPTVINQNDHPSLETARVEATNRLPNAFLARDYEVSYILRRRPHGCTGMNPQAQCGYSLPFGQYHYGAQLQATREKSAVNVPAMLSMISLFRSVPLGLKAVIYDSGKWLGLIDSDTRFAMASQYKIGEWGLLQSLVSESAVTSDRKTIKLFHLSVPHPPNAVTGSCELKQQDDGFTRRDGNDFYVEARCSLEKLGLFFDWMKNQGIYDSSKIVLVSDHGWWMENPGFADDFENHIPPGWEGRMSPGWVHSLLLVKDFNARGEMSESSTLVSNADVPAIVCSAIGSCPGVGPDPTTHPETGRKVIISASKRPQNWHKESRYIIQSSYEVTESIFEPENWRVVE